MKRIISIVLLTALLMLQASSLVASTNEKRPKSQKQRTCSIEDIDAFKLKQVLSVLKLTEEKRIPFEEMYDAYRAEIHKSVEKITGDKHSKNLSDEDLLTNMRINFSNISIVSEIKVKYIDKFSEILTVRQIQQLYRAEGDFSHRMRGAADSKKESPNIQKKRGKDRGRKGPGKAIPNLPVIEGNTK